MAVVQNSLHPGASVAPRRLGFVVGLAIVAVLLTAGLIWPLHGWHWLHARALAALGYNPHPMALRRPPVRPLSAMAQLGKKLFYDQSLSASGKQSCASCHSPAHAYGPPNALSAQIGGAHLDRQGLRPPPSLEYLERQPPFSIGPDPDQAGKENVNLQKQIAAAVGTKRARKQAGAAPAAPALVPQGGLFWDGRVDTLQSQVYGPLMNPFEMANPNAMVVATKLDRPGYRKVLEKLFGPHIYAQPKLLVAEATFALARYQIEDPSFHPYNSKFDAWLEGKARFTRQELRGYRLFNNPKKGNCAGCHVDKPTPDELPPLFTDHQYEALAVPRNRKLRVNHDPDFHDIGICGPMRADMASQSKYCSMFLTPTLRNVARRKMYFHNGVYHNLKQVMNFYDFRSAEPWRIYPRNTAGKLLRYDDVPKRYWPNVDILDAPFDRPAGKTPALTNGEMRDIIAYLKTLNDGWQP